MAVRRMELSVHVEPGQVWWAKPDPTVGQEQSGRRPVLVIANNDYLDIVTNLVITVPVTTTDRSWINHVELPSYVMPHKSFAMTEQVRSISRARLTNLIGYVDSFTLAEVRRWVTTFVSD